MSMGRLWLLMVVVTVNGGSVAECGGGNEVQRPATAVVEG